MNKNIIQLPYYKQSALRFVYLVFLGGLLTNAEVLAQNFWQQTNGPYGGKIRAIAINSSGQIFVGTDNAIFRADNNGEKWTRINSNTGALSLVVNSNRHIFAGTNDGVYRSTNNGASWTRLVNTGLPNDYVLAFVINPSGHIFAGTSSEGVFKSMNNGDSWMPVNTGLRIPDIRSLAINSKGYIFAGTINGVFRTTDDGANWTAIGLNATITTLAINSKNDEIFAGTFREIYRSANDDNTWRFVSSTSVRSLVINSMGHIFAGDASLPSRGVLRSTDNGNTWTPVGPYLYSEIDALVLNAKEHIFAGDYNRTGLFRSTNNGDTWLQIGPPNTDIQSLVVSLSGHVFAGSGDWSTDNGDTWKPINIPGVALAISSSGDFFAAGSGIFRSTDNGNTWTLVDSNSAHSLAINSKNGHIFAGAYEYVLRSIDNGVTWTKHSTGLMNADIRVLAINNENGYIFGGFEDFVEGGIVRSIDNGETWTQVNTGLTFTDVRSLAINAKEHVFAGTYSGGVFRSTNNGDTWEQTSKGLTSTIVYSLVINAKGHIFAGTNGGVFRSIDNGESWTPINTGLTSPDVRSLAISPSGPIFAGTFGGGVFRNLDSELPDVMHTPQSSPQPSGKDFTVDATITDNKSVANAILNYRQGGESFFQPVGLLHSVDNHYRGSIPASAMTSRGMEYYFSATDSVGNITRFPPAGIFSVQVRVSGEVKSDTLRNPIAQPNGSEQSAYRLVSVPLELDNKSPKAVLEDNLGPYNIKKWRFFEFGVDQQLHEFPNTTAITPGKAFWLIVKDAGKVIDTGPGTTNRTDKKYAIPLQPKWNLVGNPFNFPIPVDSIRLKSGKLVRLRTFTGSWNEPVGNPVKTMQPFEGYAIELDSPDTLFINPDLSVSASSFSKKLTSSSEREILWSIHILAQCQEARDEDNVAAVGASASNAWDEMDHPEPPTIGEYVSVSFPHPEWKTLSESYCTDFRPESSEGYIWSFEVKTNIRDKVHLFFDEVESVPAEFEIWLVDEVVPIAQNLRQNKSYVVAAASLEHPKRLKLVAGKHDFVEEKIADTQSIPMTYELNQNFPNPFNPATTIRYGLPQAERVTLKIYNLLGEEVVTLMNDELQDTGYHVAIWDGRNKLGEVVGSGVYIYRFRAASFTSIKKMALVK